MTQTLAPNPQLILWTIAFLASIVVIGWVVLRWLLDRDPVVPRRAAVPLAAAVLVVAFGAYGVIAAVAVSVLALASRGARRPLQ